MLYVIGTGHHYQFGTGVRFGEGHCTEADQTAFAEMLRNLTTKLAIQVLAEELNGQALEEVGKTTSVLQLVAAERAVPHLFCEPDRRERGPLGIRGENEIRISSFPNRLDEEAVQTLVAESWRRRELEWLRRLDAVRSKNVLFVCGARHISTFVQLALDKGFGCTVVHAAWEV